MARVSIKAALAVWASLAVLTAARVPTARAQTQPDDALRARVDSVFAEWDRPDSPGCALGIIRDGEFVYRRGYGMANLEHDVPISSKTVFYIASTSKQFVAASVILAAEQGYLSLDDDVREYIPELPDYGDTITIRHLLHHTSGLRDYLTLWSLAGEEFADVHEPEDALAMIVRQKKLNFRPGAEFLYSNTGYFLLSVILERATGKTLREFAHEHIFGPLGMRGSHFHDDRTHISKNRAIGHVKRPDGTFGMYVSNFDLVGSGGLHTSVDDLLLWDRNFYQNRLGRGTLLEELHRRGVLTNGDTLDYAAGLRIAEYRGLRTVDHGGSAQGYRTQLLRFPDQRFSVIVLCNLGSINPTRLARRVADIYLADAFTEPKREWPPIAEERLVELTDDELRAWSGAYRDAETGAFWKIIAEDGRLKVDAGGRVFRLAPLSADRFRSLNPAFDVIVRFEREPRRLHVETVDGDTTTYEAVEPFQPNAARLAEYAGEYYSDELEATWLVEVRDDSLFVEGGPEGALAPTVEDEFRLRALRLEFVRDDAGRVAGIVVDAGRVRGLQLERVHG
jgi:CubicO group peptidase (beta-lactamase class C family)